jgi:hypothetical protein
MAQTEILSTSQVTALAAALTATDYQTKPVEDAIARAMRCVEIPTSWKALGR